MTALTPSTQQALARNAVRVAAAMWDATRSEFGRIWVSSYLTTGQILDGSRTVTGPGHPPGLAAHPKVVGFMQEATSQPWRYGQLYVLGPSRTVELGHAAAALDPDTIGPVAGDVPTEHGALLLQAPLYQAGPHRTVIGVAALTWTSTTTTPGHDDGVFVTTWARHGDPQDPTAVKLRTSLAALGLLEACGPYLPIAYAWITLARPTPARPDRTGPAGTGHGPGPAPRPAPGPVSDRATATTLAYLLWQHATADPAIRVPTNRPGPGPTDVILLR